MSHGAAGFSQPSYPFWCKRPVGGLLLCNSSSRRSNSVRENPSNRHPRRRLPPIRNQGLGLRPRKQRPNRNQHRTGAPAAVVADRRNLVTVSSSSVTAPPSAYKRHQPRNHSPSTLALITDLGTCPSMRHTQISMAMREDITSASCAGCLCRHSSVRVLRG